MEPKVEDTNPQEDSSINVVPKAEEEVPASHSSNPALVINIQTWATPIIGIVMLVAGLLLGYFGRPLLSNDAPSAAVASGTNIEPTVVAATQSDSQAASNEASPASTPTLMEFLIGQTNHFKGDPDAPVTVIEFSDYQ
jgi:hypothetical protein